MEVKARFYLWVYEDYNGLMESSSKRIGSVTVNGMRIEGNHDWTITLL